jgi:hypothetical protein
MPSEPTPQLTETDGSVLCQGTKLRCSGKKEGGQGQQRNSEAKLCYLLSVVRCHLKTAYNTGCPT